jgi:hypothetical protein
MAPRIGAQKHQAVIEDAYRISCLTTTSIVLFLFGDQIEEFVDLY